MSDPVADKVVSLVASVKHIPAEKVSLESSLADLGFDSLDTISLLFELESAFSRSPFQTTKLARFVPSAKLSPESTRCFENPPAATLPPEAAPLSLRAARRETGHRIGMSSRRVVVTGVGAICALGHDRESIWSALRAGNSVIGPMKRVDTDKLAFKNASEVQNFDPAAHFTPSQIDHLDQFSQFALVAAREAVRDSGIEWTDRLKQRTAIVTGVSLGGKATEDIGYVDIYARDATAFIR